MLFALPAVRNTLPGSPMIGCVSDLVGFFWNMGIIALSALILLFRFANQDYVPQPIRVHGSSQQLFQKIPQLDWQAEPASIPLQSVSVSKRAQDRDSEKDPFEEVELNEIHK